MSDIHHIKCMSGIVLSGHEDFPNFRRKHDYTTLSWEVLRERFGSVVALMSYIEQRGYLIGRECAWRDYLYANGLKHNGRDIVPVDGTETLSPSSQPSHPDTRQP